MTFFGQLGVCVCATGNVASMGIGFCLALLRSRWAGLVWFHQDHPGHMQDSSLPLTGCVCLQRAATHALAQAWGARARSLPPPPTSRQSFLPMKNMSSLTNSGGSLLLFHQCDHCVTMETRLLSRDYTHLKLLIHCRVIHSAIMTWICWKSFNSTSNMCLPARSKKYSCSTYCHF